MKCLLTSGKVRGEPDGDAVCAANDRRGCGVASELFDYRTSI